MRRLSPACPSLVAVSLAVLLGGCVQTYYTRPGTLKPAMAQVAVADRTSVWQHAVTALLDNGYVPQVLNESAGYVTAKRREDFVGDALTGTLATVVVSPEGLVRVEVSGTGLFSSEADFINAVQTRQGQILQAVVAARAPAH